MNSLTEQVLEFARSWGASLVGVATRETLAGGPPSVDLEYILPGARSAVSIAVPLPGRSIGRWLVRVFGKCDHSPVRGGGPIGDLRHHRRTGAHRPADAR